jgi:uncharacterized membrane protein
MIAVLFAAAYPSRGADVWPLVAGFTLLPLFLLRLDALAPRTTRPFLACIPAGLGIAVWMQASFGAGQHPVFWSTIAVVFVAPILFLACARIRKHEGGRKSTFAAAAIACLPLFSVLELRFGHETHPAVALLPVLALGLCMLLGASGARSGLLVGLAAITTCLFQWSVETNIRPIDPDSARICVAILLASSAVFLAAPLARRSIWERSGTIAWTAPLAMLFGFPGAVEMWRATLPGSVHAGTAHAIPPLAFGILLLVAAAWAFRDRRDEFSADRASTRSSIARLGLHVAALAWPFFAVALAKALDRPQWAPAAAALGLGCALLWKRTDHPPLAYAVVGSAGLATLILLGRALGESLPSFPLPLASGLGFDFLLPAAALVAAGLVGRAAEVARARPEGKVMYGSDAPLLFAISGVAGLASLLVWITVEVENRFAEGATFRVRFGDLPARDLSLSIAWAVFALLLLFVGAGRKLGALRWVSLVLLLATIGKVFLLDLEDLEGLYRVGSFLGLAVSLLVVSLLYQRFVFRKTGAERA